MKKLLLLLSFIALLVLGSCSKEEDPLPPLPLDGKVLLPPVGGSTEPNQVYVSLSTEKMDTARRDLWDFGFYSGSEFRVILNESVKMSVKKTSTTDMSVTQVEDSNILIGHSDSVHISSGYVDNPNGVLTGGGDGIGTAIAEVSANEEDNKVYLVNLGSAIPTKAAEKGSVNVDGDPRGWKKIKILRDGPAGYKIQYANLDSPTFTTKTITKDANYNFTFFSLTTELPVIVEPQKTKWDLCFSTSVNYIPPTTVYPMSDLVFANMKGGTRVYEVLIKDGGEYADFTKAKVVEANFTASATNQMIIGINWRAVTGDAQGVKTDRFYVVKDVNGNYYKLIFRSMQNEDGERGNPAFEYDLLK